MRLEKTFYNSMNAFILRIVMILGNFVSRSVFIQVLDANYLGINGLFSNVLTILNLTELGLGTAITYAMYKPIAQSDASKLRALLRFYQRAYFLIGSTILVIGMCFIPFLPQIIKSSISTNEIIVIYMLYLAQSISTYWFFAYKTSIIIASQNAYLISKLNLVYYPLSISAQILFLVLFKNFIIYNIIGICSNILFNYITARIAVKRFPFIKEKNNDNLTREEVRKLLKNVWGTSLYKVNNTIVNATDNIVISVMIGIIQVGLYSNYLLIINSVMSTMMVAFSSIAPSVGNLNATEGPERKLYIFKRINLLNFWVTSVCAICLFVLLNPFMRLWLGEAYLLEYSVVAAASINFLMSGSQHSVVIYREACGLFWRGRYRPIAMSVLNIIISVGLAPRLGITGVLLGTIFSRLLTTTWYDPWLIYKSVFMCSPKKYYINFLLRMLLAILLAVVLQGVALRLGEITWIKFLILACLCFLAPNAVFYFVYRKTDEFCYLESAVREIFIKIRRKLIRSKKSDTIATIGRRRNSE